MNFRKGLAAFRHRNYRLFWFGQLVSLVGTWMQTIGQAWLVLQLTNSALALGVVSALRFVPVLLLSLFGGVVADRLPKRNLLVLTQSFMLVQALVLAVLVATHTVQVWQIMVLSALLGLANAFDMPTRQAFVVDMVGKDDLSNAIALNSSLFNSARIVGPAIAGVLIGALGVAILFYLNALSFLAVLLALLLMRNVPPVALRERRGAIRELADGLRYVSQTPVVFLGMFLIGAVGLFGMNFNVLLPLLAKLVLHAGASGYGFLTSAMGLGSLLAALALAFFARRPSVGRVVFSALAFSGSVCALALSQSLVLSLVIMVLIGMSMIAFTASTNTLVQSVAPDHLRGRVMALYITLFAGTSPFGSLLVGYLAHLRGTPFALVLGGAISGICSLWAIFRWRQLRSKGEMANAQALAAE